MNRTQPEFFSRSFELDRSGLNIDSRSVPVSFSSDKPVSRYFGDEVLLHGKENVDLSQLKSVGAALFNHNPEIIIGPLRKIRIDENRGRAEIGFDDDADGNRFLKKVESGSLRGVSVRYTIQKFRQLAEREEWNGIRGPAYVATRWTPIEVSLTPIPADASVGVNRSMFENIEIEKGTPGSAGRVADKNTGDSDMDKDEILKLIKDTVGEAGKRAVADAVPEIVAQVRAVLAEEAKPKMLISIDEARDLTGRAGALGLEAKSEITNMIFEGRSLAECQTKLVDIATANPDARNTGSSSRDGSGLPAKTGKEPPGQRNVTFETVDDDALFRSLANPSQFPIQ